MRIAISGSFCVGKTSLVESLSTALKGYETFSEPYHLMEEDGHSFSHPPTVDEYEDQLNYLNSLISSSPSLSIFDRSPLDFLAFAKAQGEDIDPSHWQELITEEIDALDYIFYIPIEQPDRIEVPDEENLEFRGQVDEILHELFNDSDELLGSARVVEISGDISQRVAQVLDHIAPANRS
ncbi:AAA family ATPase [Pseudobacteriovorax antillogorgiicola]|uniref:AAA domain-containing protein n=1 Tax=Pseudobacteriovorax antillogorgiicola TaxID=1513793 RepID=A0A1Y6BLL7_9BACT|nr:AAA family ATPase [Pseudobacteriovorax antillogorgiicola]TCS54581.1 AAA domain-containing protein [Pseudobacteriovorax antillogorgiicola]SMF17927.1 AAA domain-containing protein [Pseudobacteriovorax antillogorgiicola]